MSRPSAPVLFVRVIDVLDRTHAGTRAAATLSERFLQFKSQVAQLTDRVAAARADIDAARAIEAERDTLRQQLLVRVRVACEAIRVRRGAQLVVDAGATLASDGALDITADVIAALDAQEP